MRNKKIKKTNIKIPSLFPGSTSLQTPLPPPGCAAQLQSVYSPFSLLRFPLQGFLCSSMSFLMVCSPVKKNRLQCGFSMSHSSFGNIHLLQCGVLCVVQEIPAPALGALPLTLMLALLFVTFFCFPSPPLVPHFFPFSKYVFTKALPVLLMGSAVARLCLAHNTA